MKNLLLTYYGSAVIVDINLNKPLTKPVKAWIVLMRLGAKTGCHQMHERSLFVRGYQFPLCARCTGLLIGIIAGMASLLLFVNCNIRSLLLLAGLSIVLLGIDGFFQLKKVWVSTNFRRMITGILCGFFVTGFFIRIIGRN